MVRNDNPIAGFKVSCFSAKGLDGADKLMPEHGSRGRRIVLKLEEIRPAKPAAQEAEKNLPGSRPGDLAGLEASRSIAGASDNLRKSRVLWQHERRENHS
jgi:hypothetical protein